jgi:hypothetical protein
MASVTLSVFAIAGWLIAAAVMLWRGLRGRAVDDHPVCKHCGRDLFALTVDRCPECGTISEVTTGENIRIGNRQRRPMWIAAGALGVMIALLVGGAIGLGLARGVAWIQYTPTSWLRAQVLANEAQTRGDTIDELSRRRATLSAAEQTVIDQLLLQRQPDRNNAWDTRWGDWLNTSLNNGTLSKQDLESYLKNAFEPRLTIRPRTRPNASLPMESYWSVRVGRNQSTSVECLVGLTRIETVDGVLVYDKSTDGFFSTYLWLNDVFGGRMTQYIWLQNRLPAGDHRLVVTHTLSFENRGIEFYQAVKTNTLDLRIDPELSVSWAKSDLTPASIASHLKLESSGRKPKGPELTWRDENQSDLTLYLRMESTLPVALAAEVELRAGEQSHPGRSVCFEPGMVGVETIVIRDIPDEIAEAIAAGQAKVVFRGSREVAEEKSVELTEVYQGEFILDLPAATIVDERTKK